MTTDSVRLEDGCSAMTICFNLKPNYTAFVFPNAARRHRFYWMDDRDSFRDLKRDIAYLIDPHAQSILSSLATEPERQTIITTTTATAPTMNDLFDQLKYSYITYFILFYMILLLLCVGIILFLQIRYIRRYRCTYNQCLRLNLS